MNAESLLISRARFDAVIFDLDGVVTKTARVHAASWKRLFDNYLRERATREGVEFSPFDAREDYLRYVDGKLRYDGVQSFLESRGIALPRGKPEDAVEMETVCGLGNRKNALFLAELKEHGVEPYETTICFIRQLRARGFKTAIISSSKNCATVLEAVGATELFNARVDGVESARIGIAGKPAPGIFLEAARRLGVGPARAVVVEDAISGVEAGRAGGFGCVVGVNRGGDPARLAENGASVVVADLSELKVGTDARELPSALERLDAIAPGHDRRLAVFLDYDGTLTPIVPRPEDAVLAPEVRETVAQLARLCTVAIISGRDLANVRALVGVEGLVYAGSHGFDIAGPRGSLASNSKGDDFLPVLEMAERELRDALDGVPGSQVERKKYSIAVHYRNVAEDRLAVLESAVDRALRQHPDLRDLPGKKVHDLQPRIEWDKGKALLHLLKTLGLDQPDVLPIYIGDDITDEDAFWALAERGIGIVVRDEPRTTAASLALENPGDVHRFLAALCRRREPAMNPWVLSYEGFDPAHEGLREALCALGNGYFVTRGAAAESGADDVHYPGTYLAGGYNRLTTEIAGRKIENEDLVNMPNWLVLEFRIGDGKWFRPRDAEMLAYTQELDLRRGVLARTMRFRDEQGRETSVQNRRLVSMAEPHMAGMETTFTAENWSGRIEFRSALDGTVVNAGVKRYQSLANKHLEPVETERVGADAIYLKVRTSQSRLEIAQAARTRIFRDGAELEIERATEEDAGRIAQTFAVELEKGRAVTIEEVMAMFTSRDRAISECGIEARNEMQCAERFGKLLSVHVAAWEQLWRRFDIAIEQPDGRGATRMILHLHIFHLLQTTSPHTIGLDAGVPARGWHGEAYRGHIFWDELFIFPLLNFHIPEITRSLLLYRYRRLKEARRAACSAGYRGAMFPWQSGSNGREESQVVHLNPRSSRWIPDETLLQRHVNAAIAYNIWQYSEVTRDSDFLHFAGSEMFLEIAKFWASIATYNESLDRYEILGVVGPDEYHTRIPGREMPGLDNNSYTNLMAAWILWKAAELLKFLPDDRRQELTERLDIDDAEIERWQTVSRKMRVVFHRDGIISSFEGYEALEEFDWEGYARKYGDIQRLDRILEAEGDSVNRYKASKQADVLMLFYLFSAETLGALFERLGYPFDAGTIQRNIDYYLRRTSHGSTLSNVIHSWVLARSDRERSWRLFTEALRSDLEDVQGGTTPEGIHLGAMAGTVDLLERGYTGMELRHDALHFNPALPSHLAALKMQIRYRGHSLAIEVRKGELVVSSMKTDKGPINIGCGDALRELKPGEIAKFALQ